jgi:hypothetical protein
MEGMHEIKEWLLQRHVCSHIEEGKNRESFELKLEVPARRPDGENAHAVRIKNLAFMTLLWS